jgi:hypothetical protein
MASAPLLHHTLQAQLRDACSDMVYEPTFFRTLGQGEEAKDPLRFRGKSAQDSDNPILRFGMIVH